jgi:hypothetical protein
MDGILTQTALAPALDGRLWDGGLRRKPPSATTIVNLRSGEQQRSGTGTGMAGQTACGKQQELTVLLLGLPLLRHALRHATALRGSR